VIEFEHVTKRYPERGDALRDLSFHLDGGEMAFLTGHSGAGKSTLLKLIGLLERPTRGTIRVGDEDLARLPRRRIPAHRRRIGMVFQDHRLLADRSVFDNVALPLVTAGMPRNEIARRVRAALDQVGLLKLERALPLTLSSGEQQRVGIARAVVGRPEVILADEPTGNLDPELSREIFRLFERFHRVGVSLLIATHDLDLIRSLGHRTLVLKQGRLVADALPKAQPQAAVP
jgi:cell division transport system ATP-binding protein